jgi:hypothetical protein
VEVVSAAIALIVPYLAGAAGAAGGAAGRAADEGVRRLWRSMMQNAEREVDGRASSALRRLRQNPTDSATQAAAVDAVRALAAGDPQFLDSLRAMVREAGPVGHDITMTTNLSGDARIGKQINIGSAGDVTIE